MGKSIKSIGTRREVSLGILIHECVRGAIEQAVREELEAALGARRYERKDGRRGYRNGIRHRDLAGPTGSLALTVPRGKLFTAKGEAEWSSKLLPRYQRRMAELNEAVVGTYLAGGNTRRIRGALAPLLKDAPMSRSAVSRVVATLKADFDTWRERPLAELDIVYLYLDAICLRVRCASKVVSMPVLAAVAVLSDGAKVLVGLETCASESYESWKGFLNDLSARKLRAPLLAIVDGNPGMRRALGEVWSKTPVQRCCVHKLRNLERKAPKHALAEIADDFHAIVYAKGSREAHDGYDAFVRKWSKTCPGVVTSLEEAGEELMTFFRFPKVQWKTIRTTNVVERLNGEFRRRVKTQASLPSEDSALVLLFSLVASGQIKMRRIDGWEAIPQMMSARMKRAA
jgi:transposase-like protein